MWFQYHCHVVSVSVQNVTFLPSLSLLLLSSFLFPLTPQTVIADECPSPSLVLPDIYSCKKGVFPSYPNKVLAHKGPTDWWNFLKYTLYLKVRSGLKQLLVWFSVSYTKMNWTSLLCSYTLLICGFLHSEPNQRKESESQNTFTEYCSYYLIYRNQSFNKYIPNKCPKSRLLAEVQILSMPEYFLCCSVLLCVNNQSLDFASEYPLHANIWFAT